MQRWTYLTLGVGLVALVGCAEGTGFTPTSDDMAVVPTEDGGGSAVVPSPSPSQRPDGGSPPSDGGNGDDAGDDAGVDGGGTISCDPTNTCMGATHLGKVRGDEGADTLAAQGSTSAWFTVRVTEESSSNEALSMKATLTSPPGENFDLYVYVPVDDTRECWSATKSSTSATGDDVADVEIADIAGFDESRTVTVEVRHASGTCSPTAKWALKIEGDP